MSPKKYVTIATDISMDDKYKIATWAAYIRYGGGAIKRTGRFKTYPPSSGWAETFALANALVIAEREIASWSQSHIIIYNEVDYVLRPIVTKKTGRIRLRDKERAEAILTISLPILDLAESWELRDITAHYKHWRESDNPRKYAINRWCDQESRRLMKSLRREEKACAKRLKGV